MNISYEYYRTFYYVAKFGSVTQAAKALLTNQPNVTHTIHRLEEAFGFKLFVRSNRGMALSREGERLYARVCVAVEQLQLGEEELAQAKNLRVGVITLSATEVALRCFLLPVLREFHNRYPNVKLRISNHSTPQAIAALRNGLVELAVATTPIRELKALKCTNVTTIQEIAVCGAALAQLAEKPLSLKDLQTLPIISLSQETTTYRFYEEWFRQNGLPFHADITIERTDQMTEQGIARLVEGEDFSAVAVIPMDEVVFEPSFRPYCEQNLCGKYGANYTCPPDCGTPEKMEARLRRYANAMVFQTKWDIDDWYDEALIKRAKQTHNNAMLRVIERMKARGYDGVMAGASCCSLCDRCACIDQQPCPLPELRFSCLSAYCVYVKKLADACGMEYACKDGRLAFFGLYAF